MPLQKLTRAELAAPGGGRRQVPAEYVAFLRGLRPGEAGRAVLADEGATKITVKRRLEAAAQATGVPLRFLRSPAGEVQFEVPKGA